MFSMFIGGWSPVFIILLISGSIYINPIIYQISILLCEISVLSTIINLYLCNHELKQYLLNIKFNIILFINHSLSTNL